MPLTLWKAYRLVCGRKWVRSPPAAPRRLVSGSSLGLYPRQASSTLAAGSSSSAGDHEAWREPSKLTERFRIPPSALRGRSRKVRHEVAILAQARSIRVARSSVVRKRTDMPWKDRAKQSAYTLAVRRKRREEWLRANGPCKECGSWEQLEVDHIDPETKVDHKVWGWAKARREAELAKCQVLCNAHHLKKTLEQRRKASHGTAAMYGDHGCRCDECRRWKSATLKRLRAAKPRPTRTASAERDLQNRG